MKMRLLLALAGLAISFALPTFAQQTNTPDPKLRQQFIAFGKKLDEAWNNNDPSALTAFYMEDAVIVRDTGPVYGREAIEKWFTDLFKQVHISNHLATVDQNSPHVIGTGGNEIWGNGGWSSTLQGQKGGPIEMKGYFSCILVRDGDAWKFRMETFNITPAPAAPAQTK
jgi:ketosteroid isomerase-like protein